jgi:hypothetical protein
MQRIHPHDTYLEPAQRKVARYKTVSSYLGDGYGPHLIPLFYFKQVRDDATFSSPLERLQRRHQADFEDCLTTFNIDAALTPSKPLPRAFLSGVFLELVAAKHGQEERDRREFETKVLKALVDIASAYREHTEVIRMGIEK